MKEKLSPVVVFLITLGKPLAYWCSLIGTTEYFKNAEEYAGYRQTAEYYFVLYCGAVTFSILATALLIVFLGGNKEAVGVFILVGFVLAPIVVFIFTRIDVKARMKGKARKGEMK